MIIVLLFIYIFIDFVLGRIKGTREKFNNFPSRVEYPTRNMSYDLRGESYFPPRTIFPFDNSEIGPYF